MDKELKPLSEVTTRFGTTKFTVTEGLTRSTLQRLGTDFSDVPVELQIKEGFDRKDGTKFEVFKEKNDKINFRLKESDGNILLSGRGYDNLSDCLNAVESAPCSKKTRLRPPKSQTYIQFNCRRRGKGYKAQQRSQLFHTCKQKEPARIYYRASL